MKTPDYVKLAVCVLDTVLEQRPTPCPEGPMYLAFMASGYSLDDFTTVVDLLVRRKLLVRYAQCLSVGESIDQYITIRERPRHAKDE